MAGNKYLANVSGDPTETASQQTSAGAGDAGKIVALNSVGQVDITMMPTGIGPDTATLPSTENLAAGAFINVWNNGGVASVRNADASVTGKEAHGFVLSAVTSPANALCYGIGNNNSVSGATAGRVWLSDTTPGGFRATAPTGAGKIAQPLGMATAATSINYTQQRFIVLAA